jgi:predicted transcriptional regulator
MATTQTPAKWDKRPPTWGERSKKILSYLMKRRSEGYISPSKIAARIGLQWGESNKISPNCLRMVEAGILERNEKGHYRIKEASWQKVCNIMR